MHRNQQHVHTPLADKGCHLARLTPRMRSGMLTVCMCRLAAVGASQPLLQPPTMTAALLFSIGTVKNVAPSQVVSPSTSVLEGPGLHQVQRDVCLHLSSR